MKGILGIVVVVLLLLAMLGQCSGESQYEKDYKSSRNKTWSEMTPGEQAVSRDVIEWELKQYMND